MPLNLIQNTAHPYFTPRVTEVNLPQGPSSSLSVNQISNSHQQPHSLNVLKQDVQNTEIDSSKKTAQSKSVYVFEEIKDTADNCIGILAKRGYETAASPLVYNTAEGITDQFCYMLSDKRFSESDFLKILLHLIKEDISITEILPKNIQHLIARIEEEQYLKMTSAMVQLANIARESENPTQRGGIANLIFDLNDLGNSKSSHGVSEWIPEDLIIHLSNSMIKKIDRTQQGIETLTRLFQTKKSQHSQQSNPSYLSYFMNLQTNRLLNSLSLASPIKYSVIPLAAVLTNELKNIINQQVKNYVALNNSKASYEVFYENPIGGAQAKIQIKSVSCDYTPITLESNDTLKARWDIISGFVDMLIKAENEKNIFGHDFAKYNYLTLDMLEKNDVTHHVKISLPAHIEQTLFNKDEQENFIDNRLSHTDSWKYLAPEIYDQREPPRPTSVCYSVSAIIADVLGFALNKDYTNIPLANKVSEIIGVMQHGYHKARPSLGDAIKIFTALNNEMKVEIECEARGERTDFFAQLKF